MKFLIGLSMKERKNIGKTYLIADEDIIDGIYKLRDVYKI
jgi:hypothetical protein